MTNIILASDSYKHSHFLQLPPNTKFMSSYIESRPTDQPGGVLFVGIHAFIRDYLMHQITPSMIDEAEALMKTHGLPFNRAGWEHIVMKHNGYLPLEIQSLPEESYVEKSVPLVQVRNTDPDLPWLTSFVETVMLRAIWYPTSVATTSFHVKAMIRGMMRLTCDGLDGLPFKLHDFGGRGVSSGESAGLGAMAHLINFQGTDTIEGLLAVRRIYNDRNICAGYSIPASEHSTMTSWGRDSEAKAYSNMIDAFGDGMFSVVSDSYDLFNALENIYGGELRDKIMKIGGKLIVRPDSGDPVLTPIKTLQILWDKFGGTVNSKGYRVLNSKVGVIQGDGMNAESISDLMVEMMKAGFSIDNIAFGMGGGLLQNHTRNDLNFAMKANAISTGAGWEDIQKKPATDPSKTSKAGRQVVLRDGNTSVVLKESEATPEQIEANALKVIYMNGHYEGESFDTVRKRSNEAGHALDLRLGFNETTQQKVA